MTYGALGTELTLGLVYWKVLVSEKIGKWTHSVVDGALLMNCEEYLECHNDF